MRIFEIPLCYQRWNDEALLEARNGLPMTVHEGFRASAAFISSTSCHDGRNPIIPVGTTFLVNFDLEDRRQSFLRSYVVYAITAKHVIAAFAETDPIYVVLNKNNGGYVEIVSHKRDWTFHVTTDVAAYQLPDLSHLDVLAASTPFQTLVPRSKRTSENYHVKLGDPVFTVGLYLGFTGSNSIQPIARFGNISLMPNEREKLKVEMSPEDSQKPYEDLPEIEAYLIEVRGWEGQSGSPVFVSFGKTEEQYDQVTGANQREIILDEDNVAPARPPIIRERVVAFRPEPVCIGLIQGYHQDEIELLNTSDMRYKLNLGISIVVPSEAIIETLMSEDLHLKRTEELKRVKSKHKGPMGSRPVASNVRK
jgi:hypothetical protein